ncbi:MAG: DEAD/DEAH box helicase family protein [Proteobacteria bacterium]|nr:DEAD/DEAH box helicase family protein [Pseudomonadota bacterium]
MRLSELDLKKRWNTDDDDVLNDFYIKALSNATNYDRTTFTFSSSLLAVAARGLDGLIESGGEMRLIIGDEIQAVDYDAIVHGDQLQRHQEQCLQKLKLILADSHNNKLFAHRTELLQYLIGAKKLEIKFALKKLGFGKAHAKMGIIYGENNEKIAFEGSGNETQSGLDLNWEMFASYFSWEKETFRDYGQELVDTFNGMWDYDSSDKFKLIKLPNEDLLEAFPKNPSQVSTIRLKPRQLESKLQEEQHEVLIPKIPSTIGDNKFELRPYQRKALVSWKESSYRGILEHATGAGKTLTAIYGITKIFEASKGPIITIVGVPYTILAEQWAEEFKLFNVIPILCFGKSEKWVANLKNRLISATASNNKQLIVIIVVNASLLGKRFKEINELIQAKELETIFIGDECHEYASRDMEKMPKAKYRLGLSATPFNESPGTAALVKNENLKSYFGEIVDAFTLEDALNQNYLCPYEYHPIFIRLTEEEEREYLDLSRMIAASINSNEDGKSNDAANILLGKRARLIGSAEEKFIKLRTLAKQLEKPHNTLIFCGDGKNEDLFEEEIKDKQRILSILKDLNWDVAEFTAEVDSFTRKVRIQDFVDQTLNGLVAIKVLDQGVNIPAIQTAVIVASSRSKRQYIQRLGRVLRKSKNKKLAYIYDFIVLPHSTQPDIQDALINLIGEERKRFDEFSKCCKNNSEIKDIFSNEAGV